ncbi:MAG: N-acetylglucosamine-6-phosphate deacetylase [Pyrinomonadaceae bacterium]
MKSILLTGADIALPGEIRQTSLLIRGDRIAEISDHPSNGDQTISIPGTTIFPGFIDIHNHGAVGVDINNATAEELIKAARFFARNGVTGWLPTVVPDSDDSYQRTISQIDKVMSVQSELPVAQILGIHYEGVYANGKMCGALRSEYFKHFDKAADEIALPQLIKGIHLTTLAPEIKNGIPLIKTLRKNGWIVSIGHTNAAVETLEAASDAGANHFTHMFNAMTGIHHREIGVAGWALLSDKCTFDIIADGTHVDPRVLRLAVESKSPGSVSLISDSIAPTGLGDGEYKVWDEEISVSKGRTQNSGGNIAGSVITILDSIQLMRALGFSDCDISLMTARNPARLLKIEDQVGSLEAGKTANLTAVSSKGEVLLTIINGEIAFQA